MGSPLPRRIFFAPFFLLFCFGSRPLAAQQWDTLADIPAMFTFPVVAVADGKIHIMGGGGVGGATSAHYAYDPATDTWTPRAPVPYLAQQPAGATVDGKIHYFGGGYPTSGQPVDDHYVYDPATDSWAQAADLTAPRAIHYAVSLDETLYSLAGQGMANLCQTYDPVADAWTTKNNLPDNSFWYGAHVATAGNIYRFCGGGYTAPVNKAHRYNPASDTWTALPNMPNAIHALRGAAIGDQIFLAGGYFDFVERDEVWIFDVNTNAYTPGIPLPKGRDYHNMVSLDSCIYVVGGHHAIDQTIPFSLIRLCPFATSSAPEVPRGAALAARYAGGRLVLELPAAFASPTAQLAVFDATGRRVLFDRAVAGQEGVFTSGPNDLPAALYFVQLCTEKGVFSGKIFVY